MKKININNQYNIYIEKNFNNLLDYIKINNIDHNKIYIITDTNVSKIYLDKIEKIFIKSKVYSYIIKSGEESKNLDQIKNIYENMILQKLDRKTLIIALGGGVIGDIAGFVASTYMRGINFLQIPTSLLAQVDSSIGGKVGVDFLGKKNMIGAFYNPVMVYTNIDTLKTLPEEQFENGMVEIIKHGYILDKDYLDFIIKEKENIKNLKEEVIEYIIYTSCKIKGKIVSLDEKEKGIREILNFGHTFGHSIEVASNFKVLHGQAVALGIIASMYISFKKGFIEEKTLKEAKEIFKYFNIYRKINIDLEKIYTNMHYDKKNKNDKINIVMIKKIGDTIATDELKENEIKQAIKYILEE